jgi:hypothetical protein
MVHAGKQRQPVPEYRQQTWYGTHPADNARSNVPDQAWLSNIQMGDKGFEPLTYCIR